MNTELINKMRFALTNQARRTVLAANRSMGNYKTKIWLIGDGRSGTSWVSSLINHDRKYRDMFEPFHPQRVKGMEFLHLHQYVAPDQQHPQLLKAAQDVFSGKPFDSRVDADNRSFFYKGIIVKDIFANLFAYWTSLHFPEVKIILLLRNPFAVAISKEKKKGAYWARNIDSLVSQTNLLHDHLNPFKAIIDKAREKDELIAHQVLIWAIINYVPITQFDPKHLYIAFYEDIFLSPEQEIEKILRYIHSENHDIKVHVLSSVISQPSRAAGSNSNIRSGSSPISSWKKDLTHEQIQLGTEILATFGLDRLYGDDCMPNRKVLDNIIGSARH